MRLANFNVGQVVNLRRVVNPPASKSVPRHRGWAIVVLAGMLLSGQTPVPPAPPQTDPAAADQKAPDPKAAPAASPVPSGDNWFTGSIDLGYRWRTNVDGSLNTYRSLVNLGEGPKLLGGDVTILDPKHRVFDQLRIRANSFGDEPYQTIHLDARKSKLYNFSADYRDMAYFNFLPSYADPLLSRGIVLNEQSFDQRRHLGSYQLDLLPGNWFMPYFGYDRDSSSGTGASVFVADTNEFPVPSTMRDRTNLFRGGVHFEFRRWHATLEEGGTTFTSDQALLQAPGSTNYGNNSTPAFGPATYLNSVLAAYGITGNSTYSKGLITGNVTPWLDLYGQFLFSQPESKVKYAETDTGNQVLQLQLLLYSGQQYLVSAFSKLPHTSASAGAEIRPFHRLRITESWMTDRLHNAGSLLSNQTLTGGGGLSAQTAALLASSLITNYNQEEINAFFDVTPKLMLRGGYRYVWGNAADATLPPAGLKSSDQGQLRRNVGLAGVTFRPTQKLSVSGQIDASSSSSAYFRTSLYNYQKIRAQARYQLLNSLNLSADFTLLRNQNPTAGVNYNYRAAQESVSLFWAPKGGKIWDMQGSYSRSDLRSEITYLAPQTLLAQTSLYHDNAHTATVLFNVQWPRSAAFTPRLTAGGSFFISSGSRPTHYYQPVATLWVPVVKHINWFTEWRYYGYGEAFYLYEGFHTHLFTTGLRFTR